MYADMQRGNANRRPTIIALLAIVTAMIALPGCSSFGCCMTVSVDGEDSQHYVILGIGVVSIPKPGTETAILATQSQALGLHISDQPGMKLGLGYSTSSTVAIPDHAEDVRVEISQRPGGPITVDSPKAHLKQP